MRLRVLDSFGEFPERPAVRTEDMEAVPDTRSTGQKRWQIIGDLGKRWATREEEPAEAL
jgi:hypothetical protein